MKWSQIMAVAALGTVALSTGASATAFNFTVPIEFDNVAAVNANGGNADTNLASAA